MLIAACFAVALLCGLAPNDPPLVLENAKIRLEFDPKTGDWLGLTDRTTGAILVAGGRAPLVPPQRKFFDAARMVKDDARIDLAGDWLYTPKPPGDGNEPAFREGKLDAAAWETTPVPSRKGVGDNRLQDRTGDFWYHRTFTIPAGTLKPDEEMALLIGAIDDFDVAYVNGTRIGRTGQDTPHFWETPRLYRFPASLLREGPNRLMLKVTNGSGEGGIAGPLLLGRASALSPSVRDADDHRAFRFSRGRKGNAATLALSASSGGYSYRQEWALPEDSSRVRRTITVTNTSAAPQLFQTASYDTPSLKIGDRSSVIFPGSLPVGDVSASKIEPGDSIRPRTEDPLVVIWDEASKTGIGSWFVSEDEFAPVSVSRSATGVAIRHAQQIIVRLKPKESVTLGTEHFWVARGSRTDALRGVQEVYREIGLRAPDGAPSGLRAMVLYCGHPGGPPELNYRSYGGFRAIEKYLPTLENIGVDLLWFLPIWEHGDGVKWNLYSPFDHFQVSPLYGSADALKQLSAEAAKRKMRLMFDLVPHGPPDTTALAKEHPEWIARNSEGKLSYGWDQLAFDNAHPGWQDYFRRVADHDATQFDALGARVDCAAGGPLNWNAAVTNRPSRSSLAAGLGMTRAIREGFLRVHKSTVIIPEEYTGANIYTRVSDLTYDAQLYFLMADLLDRKVAPAEWASSLQRFLHDQHETLPPGALKMRWISNHDTVSWTFQKKRPISAYGVDRMRALMALCALVEGVPMLYQGDEDPAVYGGQGPSSVAFLKTIYAARKTIPAIRDGQADYDAVHASDGVFACLRSSGAEKALVLISFNPDASATSLTASPGTLPAGQWRDALSNEAVDASQPVPMTPHQVRILVPALP